jgi:hypothetical protein
MRKACVLVLAVLLVPLAAGASQNAAVEKARNQSQGIVVIVTLDDQGRALGQGSGFIVTASGAVVTSLHVVKGASKLRVKLPNGDVYHTDEVIDYDADKDIAIIKIKGFQLPVVKLGDSDRTEVGEQVVAISSPEGLTNSLSTGVISGVRRLSTHRVFQITAPISQGSSGGALFDSNGDVIGIATYILRSGQNINFAVPINYVRGMISDHIKTSVATLPSPTPLVRSEAESVPGTPDAIVSEINSASRGRLGRSEQEPMFIRPDEAWAFFYRTVDGIGQNSFRDLQDLTRTAALEKTQDDSRSEQYVVRYVTQNVGIAFNFKKPERLLESVDLLVTWSVETFERTFGDKYKKKTFEGQPVFEFKKTDDKKQIRAFVDPSGMVRVIRIIKVK